ncbi:DUF397 domain-containing protein [Streptomyces sp. NPDC046275]|uniref:DUF397 domain-containing protein n=1 Tax=Streptomyces sp. NPDC046275 TaxID=3157201 RepID=UPI0033F6BAE8
MRTHTDGGMGPAWRKSSYSGGAEGQCVEVAEAPGAVHVRDSKNQAGPMLTFTPSEFAAFTAYAAAFEV